MSTLRAREPERFDVLEFLPGEEAQVDYGLGALTQVSPGKWKRPLLFVMTLKYSGKSFRTTVWKTSQQVWAQLHERAFRALGCPKYVVLDNLKEGVLRPDLYEPQLNPVYTALLAHYDVVADPCRVRDPNRKGTVESAIQHTQGALSGSGLCALARCRVFFLRDHPRAPTSRRGHPPYRRVPGVLGHPHPLSLILSRTGRLACPCRSLKSNAPSGICGSPA